MVLRGMKLAVALLGSIMMAHPACAATQDQLTANVKPREPTLKFDWPDIQVGVGSYEEGPTGLTIIRFARRAGVVADSRGGAPGTVNTDALRLGYGRPSMDAIVFSGGSSYGEEAITATMTGLKDEGVRSGAWGNIAFATGAIIYDFGARRLNEVYPDNAWLRQPCSPCIREVSHLGHKARAGWPCREAFWAALHTRARVPHFGKSTA